MQKTTNRSVGPAGNTSLWKRFLQDESGMGTVEVVLIIVVLIGLVIIFKNQITNLVKKIFKTITKESNEIIQ